MPRNIQYGVLTCYREAAKKLPHSLSARYIANKRPTISLHLLYSELRFIVLIITVKKSKQKPAIDFKLEHLTLIKSDLRTDCKLLNDHN